MKSINEKKLVNLTSLFANTTNELMNAALQMLTCAAVDSNMSKDHQHAHQHIQTLQNISTEIGILINDIERTGSQQSHLKQRIETIMAASDVTPAIDSNQQKDKKRD